MNYASIVVLASACVAVMPAVCQAQEKTTATAESHPLLTGEDAKGDWTTDAPGVRRKITVKDLPAPYATDSVDNGPKVVKRPEDAWPQVPAGFKVNLFAENLENPRMIRVAPNGDLFVAESRADHVKVLRDTDGDGKADMVKKFATNLKKPFGIAFYPPGNNPQYIYIANTGSIIRFPYKNGQTQAEGKPEVIVSDLSAGGELRGGGHWTRDIIFSPDGKRMYVSIGSKTNVAGDKSDEGRARIFEFTPDGKNKKVYADGIRNPVGIRISPVTGEMWTSVNERDGLGDHLPPDYITSVKKGGFYGWPWFYIGDHQDPRHKGEHEELRGKVVVPDVLLQSHTASLGLTFYTGDQFPAEYKNDIFAAQHGSWNRKHRTGYKVIRVPMKDGKAVGEYDDFMTGLVANNDGVWGRPVAVAVAKDGSLLVSDDGGKVIWRVSYHGKK